VARAAAEVRVPGRLQVIAQDPLTIVDAAHNPDGIAALVQSLPEVAGPRTQRLVAVLSILDDKDAAGMLDALLAVCQAVVFTSSQNPRALPPPTLQSLARQLDGPPAEIVPDPRAAVERARQLAGPSGAVVAAGSIYLVADLLRPESVRRVSTL
jgi:dihydrofolate synthase/folylpolyglutamate synthase